jgi:hypothetical protein
MKFRLIAGRHIEPVNAGAIERRENRLKAGEYVVHNAGTDTDIVESDRDLAAKFPGKFIPYREDEGKKPVSEERRSAVTEAIGRGPWTENDRAMLEQLPEDHFKRIIARVGAASTGQATPAATHDEDEHPGPSTPLGSDVTHKFQGAYDGGLKVYANAAGAHQVVDPARKKGAKTKPVNAHPLKENEVDDFVGEYLKDVSG